MKEKKMRKVFLEDLPKGGLNRGNRIDWCSSLGKFLYFIYDDITGYIKIKDYMIENQILIIIYNNEEFKIKTSNLQNCKLGKIINKYTSDFKIEIGTKFKDNNRDLIITDRKIEKRKHGKSIVSEKLYKYKCNKDNYEGWIIESNLLGKNKGGCACCHGTPILGINTIFDTDKWMIPIINDEEFCKTHTANCHEKIQPTCVDCGEKRNKKVLVSNIYQNHSIGCSCGDGIKYPNKFANELLKQLNIEFESEYSPNWISPKRYDFYFKLNNKEYMLEMDGAFHYNDNKMNGNTLNKSEFIDCEKDKLANSHGIEVIRIDCNYDRIENRFNHIKQNILEHKLLNSLVDLSQINWSKCDQIALSNLVKMACEFKRNNPNLTTTEIGNIMGFSTATIIRWLKEGNRHNWCDYNSKDEYSKNLSKNQINNCKKVEIFKEGISLGKFDSVRELSNKSEELFGIRLLHAGISNVCRGDRQIYKGYTFKHI